MALTQHLLTTKIQIPPLPLQTVQRTRLLEALDRGLQPNIRVTRISAPAGYGKTTLLSAWIQSRELAAAWLSVGEGENDPARFMTYLIAAFEKACDGLEVPPLGEGQIPEEEFQQRFLIPLINQIGQRLEQTVLVLDDYHLIQSQTVHDLTGFLLENLTPQAHVYIGTRADPPLPFARLRGRGQVNELRMDDLRFRIEETESFLNVLFDLQLQPDEIQTLHQRTEGWISGLQMAAASLRGQEDVKGFIEGFSGSHHYIMDYLLDEVLRRESQELQTFLLETSILERLSAPLCDAVRGLSGDGPSPSQQILQNLEQANLFIVPLDQQREWYRYHRLFADLLLARLRLEDSGRIPMLHCRASAWFEEHGWIDEAVWHAISSGDDDFAADLVERYSQEVLLRSETTTFLRWVQRLPEEQIQIRPKLGIYRAWALLLQGAPLSAVESQIRESRERRGPPGSSRSLEAFIFLSQGQIEQGLQLAEEALEMLPAEEIYLRDFAVICAASARISLGDIDGGAELMDQATRITQRSGNKSAAVMILCEFAELRFKQLQLDAAKELYTRALELGTNRDGVRLPIAGQAMMGLGDIALERYSLESAERFLLDGIQLARRWSLISTLNGHLSLAILYDASGKAELLQDTLATLHDLSRRFDASEIDDIVVEMLIANIELRRGNLNAARKWVFDRGLDRAPVHKPARYRENYLASKIYKYELPILARWHIAEARYQDALDILQELACLAKKANRPYLLIESGILQARTYYLLEDSQSSLKALKKALDIAGPERSRRIFLTEGDDVIQLLKAGRQEWDALDTAAFVDSLLNKIEVPASRTPTPVPDLVEPLSPRELEVLRLLPSGLSAVELADELSISINTLRSHLKNIYTKLGVHSRHEAVVKAAQLDLQ